MLMEVVMAGFGGQGLMLIGKLLAEASMDEGKEVSWLPSYGPEMRGGTANCTVVVSDKPVASPVINMPQSLVVMNRPSLDKFGPQVKSGGLIIINSSMIEVGTGRDDVTEVRISANDEAQTIGSDKCANMVMLGTYIAITEVCSLDAVIRWMEHQFEGKDKIIDLNRKALKRGYELGKAQEVKV
ncbi:2-oxoacid:acceptor oxidoreductase family protein [bacterium]|jgi:2-oxoglutarate ferredoxin oxidoreductase subunit gamma|nr:2-oxoacid:acceptor oxidoreductase family protein [bacterium]